MAEKELTPEETSKIFEEVKELLTGMLNDRSVPRNIKRVSQKCIDELNRTDETSGVLSANAMYSIGDISTDPNVPFHTRTTVYRIISILERVKDS
ncbi:hypothetical protein LCGC14_1319010 [marine sediment metagenome]|uniref:Uncharacterized protein n=1 Tax=marine sediment metagenome TaxID=412755 RepID=A0A0F9KKK8_9ZZZZ|nr:MAG: hypothetical protein Lokiarch_34650 [Candidatus Lokiarchaeum sp. GC14_75]